MNGKIECINPEGLIKNPAFSQIVTTQGNGKTIYIGGQNAVNSNKEIIGKGNITEQTEQVMQNLQTSLTACGAAFENLVKVNFYMVQGQDLISAFQVSQKYLSSLISPPAISVLMVAGLTNPVFLVEIEAIAFIPE